MSNVRRHLKVRRAVLVLICLAIAGAVGTMVATAFTCGVGLLKGTHAWCGLQYIWLAAVPLSVLVALLAGPVLHVLFQRFRIQAYWQYALAGGIASLPLWVVLAQPFESVRWRQSGLYDTLNYVGTGLLAAVFYRFLAGNVLGRNDA